MIPSRLTQLRAFMIDKGLSACIIPSSDPHQSEYVATHWDYREWISGFSGSAGLVIVMRDSAGLWTDSRYFLQAEDQLKGTGIDLHKVYKRSIPGHLYWLRDKLNEGDRIAIDGKLFSKSQYDSIENVMKAKRIEIKTDIDFVNATWTNRPTKPTAKIFSLDIKYAGVSRSDKLRQIQQLIQEREVNCMLVSKLDEIAWVLNLRGSDVRLNPVFVSYLIIDREASYLFVDGTKLDQELTEELIADKVHIKPYDALGAFLSGLEKTQKVLFHSYSDSIDSYNQIGCEIKLSKDSIIENLKSKKNPTECSNFRQSMIKDGVALTHAFVWLEDELKNRGVSEYEFAKKIASSRSQQALYHDESFDAIVGYKGNGAIIHYRPEKETCAMIENNGILLVDSGGQYYDGTTDITRTICFDQPTAESKISYTAVLKGMISLSMAVFPIGTTGSQLDALARQHLWAVGKNFLHGTGHGVGFFLNVHEGPQGILSGVTSRAQKAFEIGMITSNEPGYYLTDQYGIRIENLTLCVPSEDEGYLKFETITLFPIETKMINFASMTKMEIKWLNDYHAMVYAKLSPELDEKSKKWLAEKCASI
jgi:Xaa-Pro aminopeptidase